MYEYDFHTYSVRRRRSKKKFVFSIVLLLAVVFVVGSMLFSSREEKEDGKKAVSPLGSPIAAILGSVTNNKNEELKSVVQENLGTAHGKYGISIKHLHSDQTYTLNEHHVFESASLYKLWVMATVFEQIEKGTITESDSLHGDVAALNEKFGIASESAERTEGEVHFTVGSALQQMITISHNYAALVLTEKVKLSQIRAFLTKHGLTESKVGSITNNPETTAYDTTLFFEKLMNGELANEEHTKRMIDLLKAQRLNHKLPKYLPVETVVAHKTGELGLLTHDAGIVYAPTGEYIIVVLSETPYPPEAQERIATISKAVYEYLSSNE